MTTAEYGLSKAARSFNSRLDKSKLVEAGFTPLPTWQDEDVNLYYIVEAAVSRVSELMRFLRRKVKTEDLIDLPSAEEWMNLLFRKIQSHTLEYCLQSGNVIFYLYDSTNAITHQEGEKSSNRKNNKRSLSEFETVSVSAWKGLFFAKIFVPYLTTA